MCTSIDPFICRQSQGCRNFDDRLWRAVMSSILTTNVCQQIVSCNSKWNQNLRWRPPYSHFLHCKHYLLDLNNLSNWLWVIRLMVISIVHSCGLLWKAATRLGILRGRIGRFSRFPRLMIKSNWKWRTINQFRQLKISTYYMRQNVAFMR